jgi:hypothetical protein
MKHEEKVKNLETSVAKTLIRSDLCNQTSQFINNNEIKSLVCITLPAVEYGFEKNLINSITNNFGRIKNVPSIQFHCAEMVRKTLHQGIKNMAKNCTISNMTIETLLSQPIVFSKAGIGRIDPNGEKANDYNFVWADYCKHPDKKTIDNIIEKISLKEDPNGLYYFTFNLDRKKHLKIIRELQMPLNESIQNAVHTYVLNKFKKTCSKNSHLVYSVLYTGGRRSTMITVGILVGKKNVDTVIENRQRDSKAQTAKNAQLFYKIKQRPRNWLVKPMKARVNYKTYGKSNLTDKDRRKIKISYIVGKGLGFNRKEIAKKIANKKCFAKRNISIQQISAVISWIVSPKLKAKVKNGN